MRRAFTLAEVLITLGIIGIVAAMTIPNLIAEHQKRVRTTGYTCAEKIKRAGWRIEKDYPWK